jgi:hypothetical protein
MAIDEETKRRIIDLYFNQRETIRAISAIVKKSSRDIEPVVMEHKQNIQSFQPCIHENSHNDGDVNQQKGRHKQMTEQSVIGCSSITSANSPDSIRIKFDSDNRLQLHPDDYDSALPLQHQLGEAKEENRKLRQTIAFQRLEKQLYDGRGIFDIKQMPIIQGEPKENLETVIWVYNKLISEAIKRTEKFPLNLYVVTRTKLLAPIRLYLSFKDKHAMITLDAKRLN